MNRPPPPHVVYVMYCADHVKIGYSANHRLRHASLCGAMPLRLTVLALLDGDRSLERALHERFKSDRVNGEWFRLSAPIRAFLNDHLTDKVGGLDLFKRAEDSFRDWAANKLAELSEREIPGCKIAPEARP